MVWRHSSEDLPRVLAIIAPIEELGSRLREEEIEMRTLNVRDFLRSAFAKVSRCDIRVVSSSAEMLIEVQQFSSKLKQNRRPFLLFDGHGADDGRLLFHEHDLRPGSALKRIERSFRKYRPSGVNKWPLRCIFTHCYGHLLDTSTPRPGEIIPYSHNMEFAYLTSDSQPLSFAHTRSPKPPWHV